ncbi:protease [Nonomuraea monospora]|uniref:Protease n=1 Tax=Nonomuraea monospora TaxID=568818 RepID=A0ABP5PWF7_9ACTN
MIVLTGTLTVPETALAAPAIRLAAQAPLQPADVAGSVEYLTTKYGIGVDEAMRRLELQRTAGELQDVLTRDYAETYAGSWIDQDNGGVLVVAGTSADMLTPALSAVPDRDHIRVATVQHSLKELKTKAADVSARLGLTPLQAPVINQQQNRVELHRQAALAVRGSAGRRATADDLDVVVVDPPTIFPKACSIQSCDAPMRGGLKLDLYDYNNQNAHSHCTNGFNVHGSNGWQYTLTAGHCLEDDLYYTKHRNTFVGRYNDPTSNTDYPWDAAIVPYVVRNGVEYVKTWVKAPRNLVYNSRLQNPAFPIAGHWEAEDISAGWVACATGATSNNTRCGKVLSTADGIIMDVCVKAGDSGGPLFSEFDHKGYGILSASNSDDDICDSNQRSYWSPLSTIFDVMEYQSGITFSLNTTA